MEVNEVATRLLRRYWAVLMLAVLVPVVAAGLYVTRQKAVYTAHARIVATATTPRSLAEAAGVVSQVNALATGHDLVATALSGAHIPRDPATVADAVTVTGLGSSALVDLAYTDRDPATAQAVTSALATAVTTQIDAVQIGGLPDVLKSVDAQLTDLATQRAPIAAAAQANPKDPVAQNRLAGIDRLISDLSGDRNRLAEDAAAAGHSTVVAAPVRPAHADSRGLASKLGIAAILGLAIGLLMVGINETMRPSVSGAVRVSRLLEVPAIGAIGSDPVRLADIGRRLRLAASRASVSTIVLVRATLKPIPPELVDRIEAAVLRPDAVSRRVSIPIDAGSAPVAGTAAAPLTALVADGANQLGTVAVLTMKENSSRPVRLRRVCALDELDPAAEQDHIGLVVLAGGITRLTALGSVRDLMAAAGWPLLGVLSDP